MDLSYKGALRTLQPRLSPGPSLQFAPGCLILHSLPYPGQRLSWAAGVFRQPLLMSSVALAGRQLFLDSLQETQNMGRPELGLG